MNKNEPSLPEESLFLQAIEIDSPDEQAAFLDRACAADAELRRAIEALLRHHREGSSYLEVPPTEVVAAAAQLTTSEAETPALDFLSPSNNPPSLGRLGYYEVLEVLGHGGFGVVLKARDTKLDRIVAVKTLSQSLATSATARKRFVREAKAAAAVKHENVVGIYHVADDGLVPYLVMECVSGVSLEAKLQQVGTLDLPAILRIGTQVASGLAAAHKQGLVHRDVKPGNILLENGVERVKITDFGLARAADDVAITRTGEVAGTPQYMSPEQAQGLTLDARSDLFSLGSVLYAMGTGRSPFRAESTVAALRRVCDDMPRPIREINRDIPDWLAEIINRLLAKQPSDRFQTATEVAELLGFHLAHVQQSAIVSSPKPTIVSPRRPSAIGPRWWSVALIALVAVACIMGFTEASGVTKVVPTVIRIVRGEGTLVIEVDDPTVQVSLDGEALSIRGAGLKELKLLPGKYRLHAKKDGQPVKDEVVTITRDGRKVVTVTLESPGGSASVDVPPADKQPVGELTLLAKLDGHSDLIRAVAFLPDGRRMVSVGRDKLVRTWDLETRSVISTFSVRGYLQAADVSADGRFVALGVALDTREKIGMIYVWDLENRKQVCEVPRQKFNWLNYIRFTPDGTRVVTTGDPPFGVLWDISTGKEVQHFDVDASEIHSVAFSPDGRLLAIGAVGRVRLFDVESGDVLGDSKLPESSSVLSLAFAPGGDSLACGQMGGHTSVIDVNTRQLTASLTNSKSSSHVVSMRFLDNERLLITRFNGMLEAWDLPRTKIVATAASEGGTTKRLAISPDARYALTADGEGWDEQSKLRKPNGDYALRLWQLPESVWPAASRPTSLPADTTNQTPKPQAEIVMLRGPSNIYGPLEDLNARIAAVPRNGKLYYQRSLWFAAREQWKEALLDAEKCLALEPRWYNRTDLARLYLNLGDRDRYEQLCRELLQDIEKEPTVGAKCGSFRPLYLEPSLWQKEIEAFAPIVEAMHAREPQQDEVRRTVIATRYRQGRWKECIEAAETMQPAGPTNMNGGYPWLFRIMAMHQLGQTTEAKAALQEWKTFIERQTAAAFSGGHWESHPVDIRLQWCMHNGREAQILYREASQLILGKREELRLQPTVPSSNPPSKDLGADVDLGGPGAAYERWKQTPEYQVWLKDRGQTAAAATSDVEPLRLVRRFAVNSAPSINAIRFAPDGASVVTASRGNVDVWDLESGQLRDRIQLDRVFMKFDFPADGLNLVGVTFQGNVLSLEWPSGMVRFERDAHQPPATASALLSASQVATAGHDGFIRIWDAKTGEQVAELPPQVPAAPGQCYALAASLDGRYVVVAGNGWAAVWDVPSRTRLHNLQNHPFNVHAVAISPDGRHILTGGATGRVQLFELDSGQLVRRFDKHTDFVLSLEFLADGRHFVSGAMDGSLRVSSLDGQEVARQQSRVNNVSILRISSDGRRIVSAGGVKGNYMGLPTNTTLHLWELPQSLWPDDVGPREGAAVKTDDDGSRTSDK